MDGAATTTDAGDEVAEARVYDTSMTLIEVRTGPQVDWMLARGLPDSYGRMVNRWWVVPADVR